MEYIFDEIIYTFLENLVPQMICRTDRLSLLLKNIFFHFCHQKTLLQKKATKINTDLHNITS